MKAPFACVTSVPLIALLFALPAHAQQFSGQPKIVKVDATHWELLEDLSFVDKNGVLFQAPKGYKTDGASIPWPLWSVIGSPFTGNYVSSAIIHDVYCDLKSRDWKLVHRTFYDAMIAEGSPSLLAKVMYFGVYRFGPKWVVDASRPCPFPYVCVQHDPVKLTLTASPEVDIEEFKRAKQKIESENPELTDIEGMAQAGLFAIGSKVRVVGEERKPTGAVRNLDQTGSLGLQLRELMEPN